MRGPSLLLERRAFNRAVTSAVSLMSLRSGAWGEQGRDRGEWGRNRGEWGRNRREWGRDRGEQRNVEARHVLTLTSSVDSKAVL